MCRCRCLWLPYFAEAALSKHFEKDEIVYADLGLFVDCFRRIGSIACK